MSRCADAFADNFSSRRNGGRSGVVALEIINGSKNTPGRWWDHIWCSPLSFKESQSQIRTVRVCSEARLCPPWTKRHPLLEQDQQQYQPPHLTASRWALRATS